jgi:hypothetical protein
VVDIGEPARFAYNVDGRTMGSWGIRERETVRVADLVEYQLVQSFLKM